MTSSHMEGPGSFSLLKVFFTFNLRRGKEYRADQEGVVMLLAIDIGNTNINMGVFDGDHLVSTWGIATDVKKSADEYAVLLSSLLTSEGLAFEDIEDISMACVVPSLLATMEDLCSRYIETSPLVIGPGVKTGVRVSTDNPREVGADRIVNAAAANRIYGGTLIVIDFGTATTFDVISKRGDYLGGAIAPGIGITAEALFTRTSKLPHVELVSPEKTIGKNSIEAMQSGIMFGYVGLIESLVTRIRKELGEKAKVIATGGLSSVFASETKTIDIVDKNLTLIGLRLIHEMNR
jgi:type III pantothenate kinase